MCECFVCIYVCAPHVCLMPLETRRALVPLELELGKIASHHVSSQNPTQVLCNSSQALTAEPSPTQAPYCLKGRGFSGYFSIL